MYSEIDYIEDHMKTALAFFQSDTISHNITCFYLNVALHGQFLFKWMRCTLGSDKVLINRRNVVTEVKKKLRCYQEISMFGSRISCACSNAYSVRNFKIG